MEPKRIYLAGKIGPNDWRQGIVSGLKDWRKHSGAINEWPELQRAIFNRFTYVGPFYTDAGAKSVFQDEDIPTDFRIDGHGYPQAWVFDGKHCGDDAIARGQIVEKCLLSIKHADIVFAWIDEIDAHGTFTELGYAFGLGNGRAEGDVEPWGPDIYVASPPGFDSTNEAWFPMNMATCGGGHFANPAEALRQCLIENGYFFDSPLERNFWLAWLEHSEQFPLELQYEVFSGRYRLDFAHLATKTAIEVDGFAYHSDRKQFARDRKRDRELTEAGWKVIRFASQELTDNIGKCVEQAARMIRGG